MIEANVNIESVKAIIRQHVNSKENPTGVLTSEESEYLGCVDIKSDRLQELLNSDETKWIDNNELIKKKALEIASQLSKFVEKQKEELNRMMKYSLSKLVPRKSKLKKLPMWGEQVKEDQIDFEWPTEEILDGYPPDIKLI